MPRTVLPILLVTAALVAWLFGSALTGASSFGFRDAAHYYHPLFEYIRGEWGAGRLPLWNPYENCGTPLVAEATSSVFYPGKLWFALPLDYTWLYNQYIVLHVVLAAGTAYRLARHLKAPPLGATLGAISYAFGGYVLFQYGNVIFLVGAAWLPLALLHADRMLREKRNSAIVGFGMALALIVLGGDPHLAYNVALAATGYAVLLWRNDRRKTLVDAPPTGRSLPLIRPLQLALGLALAGLLSAVQVMPSVEASPYGSRSHFDAPRNVYELVQTVIAPERYGPPSSAGLLGARPKGHRSDIYQFSVEPWRAIEMLWPNVTGHSFLTPRRWLHALNLEHNLWIPSLYFGLLPLLLALRTWSLRSSAPAEIRGLSWLALLSGLASFGWYGLGGFVSLAVGDSQDFGIGNEFGGLYWLMTVLLPGYIQFRYPAKLFVLTSLAVSMLAARGWRAAWTPRGLLVRWLLAVPVVSLAAGIAAVAASPLISKQLASFPPNIFSGPFDVTGAWSSLIDGLIHASVLGLALAGVFHLACSRPRYRVILKLSAIAIVAVDLAVSQRGLIELSPAGNWLFMPEIATALPDRTDYRVYRELIPVAPSFAEANSPHRHAEAVRWDRETLSPKYPLAMRIPLVVAPQNVAGHDYKELVDVARDFSRRHGDKLPIAPSVLDLLAARTAIVGVAAKEALVDPRPLADGMLVADRPTAIPRAWIVHRVERLPPFGGQSPGAIRKRTEQVLFPNQQSRDWRHVAVVESDLPLAELPLADEAVVSGESCSIACADPLRVEIDATLAAPGLVVLSDQYFPGWELTVISGGKSRSAPILKANRVMRAAALPAGKHRLVYRYRPRSVYWGAAISAAAALAVGAWAAKRGVRGRAGQQTHGAPGSQSPATVR